MSSNFCAIASVSSTVRSPLHDQLFGVDLGEGRPLADLAVHERLGERRLVALVVAVPAVAEHVDDDVAVELLAELQGQLGDETAASGSSPLTWKIGAWIILATSVQ